MQSIKFIDDMEFMGRNILIFMDNEMNPWFVASQLLEVMEYNTKSHTSRTIERNVDEDCQLKLNRNQLDCLINDFVVTRLGDHNSKDLAMYKDKIFNSIWKNNKDNNPRYFVNESGMYSLVLGSGKEEAKDFRRWLTKEVLPSIRKNGYYQMQSSENSHMMEDLQSQINSLQTMLFSKDVEIKQHKNTINELTKEYSEFKNEAIRNSHNGFYQNKVYSSNFNPIETFTTKMVADRLKISWDLLDRILMDHNLQFPNRNKDNFHTGRYNLNNDLIYNGLAVWLPFTEQDKCPGFYYQRWTRGGLEFIRKLVEQEKVNNPSRFFNIDPFNIISPIKNDPFNNINPITKEPFNNVPLPNFDNK